jgi:hypothetical protein
MENPQPRGSVLLSAPLVLFLMVAVGASADINSGIRAYYSVDGDTGEEAFGHDGILRGGATFSDSVVKLGTHSLDVGTVSQARYLEIPLEHSGEMTFSAWVYLDQASHNSDRRAIVESAGDGEDPWRHVSIEVGTDNRIRMVCRQAGGANPVVSIGPTSGSFPLQQWVHVVGMSYGPTIELWVNGVRVGIRSDCLGAFTTQLTDASYHVGVHRDAGRPWGGYIDEIGLWYRPLSEAEVGVLYNSGDGIAWPLGGTQPEPRTSDEPRIVLPPRGSSTVGLYDHIEDVFTAGPAHGMAAPAFSGAVQIAEEEIVFAPVSATAIGRFDASDNTFSTGAGTTAGDWRGAVRIPDGRVILVPWNSANVGIYDPVTDTLSMGAAHGLGGDQRWSKGVLTDEGTVVFVPFRASVIGIYDYVNDVYTNGPSHGQGDFAYAGGEKISDGRVVMAPWNNVNVLIYDPVVDSFITRSLGTTGTGGNERFNGVVALPNNGALIVPFRSTILGWFDGDTDTATVEGYVDRLATVGKFRGGAYVGDDRVILSPYASGYVGIVDTSTMKYINGAPHLSGGGAYSEGLIALQAFTPDEEVGPTIPPLPKSLEEGFNQTGEAWGVGGISFAGVGMVQLLWGLGLLAGGMIIFIRRGGDSFLVVGIGALVILGLLVVLGVMPEFVLLLLVFGMMLYAGTKFFGGKSDE